MSLLSVPLNKNLSEKIEEMIRRGYAANKADFARHAIERYLEDRAVFAVLEAEQEIKDGKGLTGDLDDLASKL